MRKYIITLALLVLAGGSAWVAHQTARRAPESGRPQVAVAGLLAHTVDPIIDRATRENRAAAQRAAEEIKANFRQYQRGVQPFVKDLMSWGTRLKIIGSLGQDFWNNWNRSGEKQSLVRDFVREKFSQHIVSEARLESDLQRVLEQFGSDLEANRNVLLASLQGEIDLARLPVVVTRVALQNDLQARVTASTARLPRDSVVVGVASVAAGMVAEESVRMLVRLIVAQTATRLAAMTAAAGAAGAGTTAGGAAAGGGVGSLAGPAGVMVGIGLGMAVGTLVDLWMSHELAKTLEAQCREFLVKTEISLLYGQPGQPGLTQALDETVALLDSSFRSVIHDALVKGMP